MASIYGRITSRGSRKCDERRQKMAATNSFKDLVQGRMTLPREDIDTMLTGDVDNRQGNGPASAARRYARLGHDILRISQKLIDPGVKFVHSAEAGFRHVSDRQKAH